MIMAIEDILSCPKYSFAREYRALFGASGDRAKRLSE
jgi:hypothetical protein